MIALLVGAWLVAAPAGAADALRPEIGKPLQAAQELYKAKKYQDASGKIREADAVGAKTPAEILTIERMRASVASAAGDSATAIKSFEAVIASGKLAPAEQLKMVQAVAGLYYQNKDYARAAEWSNRYLKDGGTDPQMRALLLHATYQANDCAGVARLLQGANDANHVTSEEDLQLAAGCYARTKDNAGYAAALEQLVSHYPKKDYWTDVIARLQRKPGFSDRLALDLLRLKLATGAMNGAGDFMEMAQLAAQDGANAEARKVVDRGYADKVLGVGAEAARQQRLSDLVNTRLKEAHAARAQDEAAANAAKDGNALLRLGYDRVLDGQADAGIALMEQGLRKGGLKRNEDAKLHLGIAYQYAGHKAKALQMFGTVGGADGTADLARLWSIVARQAS